MRFAARVEVELTSNGADQHQENIQLVGEFVDLEAFEFSCWHLFRWFGFAKEPRESNNW